MTQFDGARGAGTGHHRDFLFLMGGVLPLLLAGAALVLRDSGLDTRLSAWFYDAQTQQFLIDTNGWFELLGHRLGKSIVLTVWLLLLASALAAPWVARWARHRRLLWTLVAAMAVGPVVVAVLKDLNAHACPWSLKDFGGLADYRADWFVPRAEAGRCFPGGHASGGFSLLALAFAGRVLGEPALTRAGLWLGLGVGLAFSVLRVAQGAHFMSHNLWAAAIDLWTAALIFAPMMMFSRPAAVSGASAVPTPGGLR